MMNFFEDYVETISLPPFQDNNQNLFRNYASRIFNLNSAIIGNAWPQKFSHRSQDTVYRNKHRLQLIGVRIESSFRPRRRAAVPVQPTWHEGCRATGEYAQLPGRERANGRRSGSCRGDSKIECIPQLPGHLTRSKSKSPGHDCW